MTGRMSIRLPVELALRMEAAAQAVGQTPHEFILHAVAVHTAVTELRERPLTEPELKIESSDDPYDIEHIASLLRSRGLGTVINPHLPPLSARKSRTPRR
ncbi:MAG TPA: hypothetical protein VFS42_03725 [Burkholderiaceae bacterium]|nr:hypothetical protein [Burkholderiaceae bacterium]